MPRKSPNTIAAITATKGPREFKLLFLDAADALAGTRAACAHPTLLAFEVDLLAIDLAILRDAPGLEAGAGLVASCFAPSEKRTRVRTEVLGNEWLALGDHDIVLAFLGQRRDRRAGENRKRGRGQF